MSSLPNYPDVFAEAKARYDVLSMWKMLGIPGEPTHGNSFSPFREESRPSFSIYDDGRKWKDHANGLGGDSIELAKVWHDFTGPELREFLMERLGIDFPDGGARVPAKVFTPTPKPPAPPKKIEWPCDLLTGREETWEAFAKRRGLSYEGVRFMVEAGVLRFAIVEARKCFVVLDDRNRAAEIRRINGKVFSHGDKVFNLTGVRKLWMPGATFIEENPGTDWIISEGASDYTHLLDLYVRYRRSGGERRFVPMTMLGGGLKNLDPEIMEAASGRSIVLIPDGDEAGDKMAAYWTAEFTEAGATVAVKHLPRGEDLRDMCLEGAIQPEDMFNE